MNLSFSRKGIGGHTAIEFTDDAIKLEWSKTSIQERKMLATLITKARDADMQTFIVGDNGEEELTEKLPSIFFNRKGCMLIRGNKDGCQIIAKNLFESEIKAGRLIMEAQPDNSWKLVRIEEVAEVVKEAAAASKEAPKKCTSTAAVGGG